MTIDASIGCALCGPLFYGKCTHQAIPPLAAGDGGEKREGAYPTEHAYNQACKALHVQRERAEKAEAELAQARQELAGEA